MQLQIGQGIRCFAVFNQNIYYQIFIIVSFPLCIKVGIIILFMYHIEQLRSKEIADLQSIAQDLGIKGIKSLGRDELIYRILDGQAMQNSKSGAPAVVKEENRMNRREHRRNRIHADAPSKVYTATGEKAVKVEKDEPKKPKQEPESVKLVENINAQVSVVE